MLKMVDYKKYKGVKNRERVKRINPLLLTLPTAYTNPPQSLGLLNASKPPPKLFLATSLFLTVKFSTK